jgi:hypothetical protein
MSNPALRVTNRAVSSLTGRYQANRSGEPAIDPATSIRSRWRTYGKQSRCSSGADPWQSAAALSHRRGPAGRRHSRRCVAQPPRRLPGRRAPASPPHAPGRTRSLGSLLRRGARHAASGFVPRWRWTMLPPIPLNRPRNDPAESARCCGACSPCWVVSGAAWTPAHAAVVHVAATRWRLQSLDADEVEGPDSRTPSFPKGGRVAPTSAPCRLVAVLALLGVLLAHAGSAGIASGRRQRGRQCLSRAGRLALGLLDGDTLTNRR